MRAGPDSIAQHLLLSLLRLLLLPAADQADAAGKAHILSWVVSKHSLTHVAEREGNRVDLQQGGQQTQLATPNCTAGWWPQRLARCRHEASGLCWESLEPCLR